MPCILCKSSGPFRHRYAKDGYAIQECEACGLTQLHPLPSPEVLKDYYEGSYFANPADTAGYDNYAAQEAEYIETFREDVRRIGRYVPRGTILDVGCGYGYFMAAAEEAGYDVYGIDPSKTAIDAAKARFGDRVIQSDIQGAARFGVKGFDAVFASHVVEHVTDPVSFVETIRELLAPRGYVVVVTPNIRSVLSRLSRRRWVSYKVPEHVAYYSPATLLRLMNLGGLSTAEIQSAYQYYNAPFIAKRLRELSSPISKLVPPLERLPGLRGSIFRVSSGSIRLIAQKSG